MRLFLQPPLLCDRGTLWTPLHAAAFQENGAATVPFWSRAHRHVAQMASVWCVGKIIMMLLNADANVHSEDKSGR